MCAFACLTQKMDPSSDSYKKAMRAQKAFTKERDMQAKERDIALVQQDQVLQASIRSMQRKREAIYVLRKQRGTIELLGSDSSDPEYNPPLGVKIYSTFPFVKPHKTK